MTIDDRTLVARIKELVPHYDETMLGEPSGEDGLSYALIKFWLDYLQEESRVSPKRSSAGATSAPLTRQMHGAGGVEGRQVREMCEMGYGVLVSPVAGAWVLGSVIAGASESDCVDWGLVSAGNDCVLG